MANLEIPVELWFEIFKELPREDVHSTTLLCRRFQPTCQALIFKNLTFKHPSLHKKLQRIYNARRELRAFVSALDILGSSRICWQAEDREILFQLLPTLPNLRYFGIYRIFSAYQDSTPERTLILDSLRGIPLKAISLYFRDNTWRPVPPGQPPCGLHDLTGIALEWGCPDHPGHKGSSLQHLHEFIRPSLTSLVVLRLHYKSPQGFDLRFLAPASKTLRSLDYAMTPFDESILDLIPALFPDLKTLAMQWIDGNKRFSLPWKDEYILSLIKNKNLVELTLSNDFEQAARDPVLGDDHFPSFLRSYIRRLEAARLVCRSLTWLRRCNWLQVGAGSNPTATMLHPFIVEERPNGGTTDRVVRGLRQWWMGTNHQESYRGGETVEITLAKLQFLPGEVIGEDYSDSDPELDYDSDSDGWQRSLRNL